MNDSVSLTLGILALLLILFLFAIRTSGKIPGSVKKDIFEKLARIRIDMDTQTASAIRDGITRLDSLTARAMKVRFKNDLTFGDNMKKNKKYFGRSLNEDLWTYHKLRNSIVHEGIDVSAEEGKDAFKVYSKAISKLLQ